GRGVCPTAPAATDARVHGARARGDRRAPRAAPSRGVRGGAVLGARGGGAHGAESASPLRCGPLLRRARRRSRGRAIRRARQSVGAVRGDVRLPRRHQSRPTPRSRRDARARGPAAHGDAPGARRPWTTDGRATPQGRARTQIRENLNAECGVRNAECQWRCRAANDLRHLFRIPHSALRTLAVTSLPLTPVLVGPTAVGKTAVVAAWAEAESISVVSADARQVYRGLDIGTAKPSGALLARGPSRSRCSRGGASAGGRSTPARPGRCGRGTFNSRCHGTCCTVASLNAWTRCSRGAWWTSCGGSWRRAWRRTPRGSTGWDIERWLRCSQGGF